MGMILNRKNKCPVCGEECITLLNRLGLDSKTLNRNVLDCNSDIICRSCNAELNYIRKFDLKSIIILVLYLSLFSLFFVFESIFMIVIFILYPILALYQAMFGELEEYIPKPKENIYNLNEFLDGLRNEGSKK